MISGGIIIVTSMDKMAHTIVTAHNAGRKIVNGKKIYFYGTGVYNSYNGPIPKGMK